MGLRGDEGWRGGVWDMNGLQLRAGTSRTHRRAAPDRSDPHRLFLMAPYLMWVLVKITVLRYANISLVSLFAHVKLRLLEGRYGIC